MTSAFVLTIVARSVILFRGAVHLCSIQGAGGSRSFEARHEPFMTILASPSEIQFNDESNQRRKIAAATGWVSFIGGSCTILVEIDRPAPIHR